MKYTKGQKVKIQYYFKKIKGTISEVNKKMQTYKVNAENKEFTLYEDQIFI